MHNSEISQNTFNYRIQRGLRQILRTTRVSECRKHVWNVLIMSKSILNLNLIVVQTHHIYSQLEAKLGAVIVNCATKKAFSWVQSTFAIKLTYFDISKSAIFHSFVSVRHYHCCISSQGNILEVHFVDFRFSSTWLDFRSTNINRLNQGPE